MQRKHVVVYHTCLEIFLHFQDNRKEVNQLTFFFVILMEHCLTISLEGGHNDDCPGLSHFCPHPSKVTMEVLQPLTQSV